MKIGIIGSGNVGGTLTRRLQALGHDVTVSNSRGPQSLAELSSQTGVKADTVEAAASTANVVILATPTSAVPSLPAEAFRHKIVVDASNYYARRDGNIADVADMSLTSSRWTAERLPGARVVKAFNSIQAQHLADYGRPAGDQGRIALPVASDDDDAKRTVMVLVDELGFDPVDAGTLDESWRQQPDSILFAADTNVAGVREGLANAKP